jgi:ABC-2 type transport system ATP-binding protein
MSDWAVELRQVSRFFGTYPALRDISLGVRYGEIFGLLGPNGAGKTTTMRVFTTLLRPSNGTVWYEDRALPEHNVALRQNLAYMTQGHSLDLMLSCIDNLRFYAKLKRIAAAEAERQIEELMGVFGVGSFSDRSPLSLSGGQLRRVQLARTFIGNPRILLLDEPTLGIDIEGKLQIWAFLREYVSKAGCAVIVASNDITETQQTCGRVAFINAGVVQFLGRANDLPTTEGVLLLVKLRTPFDGDPGSLPAGVTWSTNEDGTLHLRFPGYTGDIIRLLATFERRYGIDSLEESRPSLADLFTAYGGKR